MTPVAMAYALQHIEQAERRIANRLDTLAADLRVLATQRGALRESLAAMAADETPEGPKFPELSRPDTVE